MRLTSGPQRMELITGSMPLIAVVNDLPCMPLAQDRIFRFLTYAMFQATFCVGAVSSALPFNSSGIAGLLAFLVFQSGWLLDSNNAYRHEATNPEIMVSGLESGQSGRESVPGQNVVNRAIVRSSDRSVCIHIHGCWMVKMLLADG